MKVSLVERGFCSLRFTTEKCFWVADWSSGQFSTIDVRSQYEIPPSLAHLFHTMRPQSSIDLPLASITMFSSLVCQGKRLVCVCLCECICLCPYLHHPYYLFSHISKCHYIFFANVSLCVWFMNACVSTLHSHVQVSGGFSFLRMHVCTCVLNSSACRPSFIALPAEPEPELRGPALSPDVDKRPLFKEHRGKMARPCQSRTNSPLTPWASLLEQFKEWEGEKPRRKGERVDGYIIGIYSFLWLSENKM